MGNRPVACPSQYYPSPIRPAIIPPHADSQWFVLVTFAIAKVGIYHMNRLKIGYLIQARHGCQYQNIDATFMVVTRLCPGRFPFPG